MKISLVYLLASCLVGEVVSQLPIGNAAALRRAFHNQFHRVRQKDTTTQVDGPPHYAPDTATTTINSSSKTCTRPTVTVYASGNTTWTEYPWSAPTITVTATESMCTATSTSAHLTNSVIPPYPYSNSTTAGPTTSFAHVPPRPSMTSTSTSSSVPIETSTSSPTTPSSLTASSPSMPATPTDGCSTTPSNYTSMPNYFGFNMVNTNPRDVSQTLDQNSSPWKSPGDWSKTIGWVKKAFPNTNAIRLYSTTDFGSYNETDMFFPHLNDALLAAKNDNIKILAGIWSTGNGSGKAYQSRSRFDQEFDYFKYAVGNHTCDNIFAVAVGNEDLNYVDLMTTLSDDQKTALKSQRVDAIVDQMTQVRGWLRQNGCCNVPVTHVDTWDNLVNDSVPYVAKLIDNVDQAVIANIFPYWSGETPETDSWSVLTWQSNITMSTARKHGKDLWLGETGYARSQPPDTADIKFPAHGATPAMMQNYFSEIGCQVLKGDGTAFYYVDWDEDTVATLPSFGLWDYNGNPKINTDCSRSKPDMSAIKNDSPSFLGGGGFTQKRPQTRDVHKSAVRSFWTTWWH